MNEPITLTVQDEVEGILRKTIDNTYEIATGLKGRLQDFTNAVAAEVETVLERYLAGNEAVVAEPERPFKRADRPLKAGDRVKLTGPEWTGGGDPLVGDIVTILEIDEDGDGVFKDETGYTWFVMNREPFDFSGELIDLDPEIRVGNTVRISEKSQAGTSQGNSIGTEFVVTGVERGVIPTYGAFYVTGDPAGRGMWENFIEKVEE